MSSTSSPTGLRHRRNQVALAEAASSASLEEPPSRPPLQQLPSPPAASGRRKVITVHSAVEKLDVPTRPFINLDGSSSPPPSSPTSPPSPSTPSPIPSSPTSPPSPTTPSPIPSSPTSPPSPTTGEKVNFRKNCKQLSYLISGRRHSSLDQFCLYHNLLKQGEGEEPEREQWGSSIEFLISCISMSVGLGNVWRSFLTININSLT